MKVIMESLRMASIISFTFREAVADVEYKGTHARVQHGLGYLVL
jgi:cytochrome P450